jgi:hypothetical protein
MLKLSSLLASRSGVWPFDDFSKLLQTGRRYQGRSGTPTGITCGSAEQPASTVKNGIHTYRTYVGGVGPGKNSKYPGSFQLMISKFVTSA